MNKKYYSKLMLAGEYGVLKGGAALTIPLEKYYAKLEHMAIEDLTNPVLKSVEVIRKLLLYLKSLPVNSFFASPEFEHMDKMVKNGCYIESTIPKGYGVGSSGAVSAIIYDQVFSGKEQLSLQQKRKDLAAIESFFHGKSSGVDPLSCFIGKPLHFLSNGEIEMLPANPAHAGNGYRYFLLDSEEVINTEDLVKVFFDKYKKEDYKDSILNDYIPLTGKLIESMTGKVETDPALLFRSVSDFQWNYFREMIPQNMEDPWIQGQVTNTYYLKLNGSGGGFLLGIAHSEVMEDVEQMLDGFTLHWV